MMCSDADIFNLDCVTSETSYPSDNGDMVSRVCHLREHISIRVRHFIEDISIKGESFYRPHRYQGCVIR